MTTIMSTDWQHVGVITSSICGWIYFLAWSASFYPQPLLNIERRTTEGLTLDFPKLNVLGFSAYSVSTIALLYSSGIREEYAARHPLSPQPTVRFNDVAFGVHALILCIITYSQFWPRLWGWENDPSVRRRATRITDGIITGSAIAIVIIALIIVYQYDATQLATSWAWLDLIYTLQYIKLLLTVSKYVPQVVSNAKRKSTAGWSMAQIQCDFVGGIFSLIQLVLDSSIQADWSGLTGNPVKFGLANISLSFDIIFMVQHYILYGPVERDEDSDDPRRPLLR